MKKAIIYYNDNSNMTIAVCDLYNNRVKLDNVDCIIDADMGYIVYDNLDNVLVKIDEFSY